ncbi:FAD-binding oxidoreductase [Streptomyces chartreusis]|uniref:FAD-binding oxidoreductase n=1 Tax=Streptomyces chartreusis TaxID=1969 RepID=UPI0037FF82FC
MHLEMKPMAIGFVNAPGLELALAAWRGVLGEDAVMTGEDQLTRYEANASGLSARLPAVLAVRNVTKLQRVLQIARQHAVPVYPVSTGHSWGLGSFLPVRPQSVVLDLSQMNKIRDVDIAAGVATIEPGVTQAQLADHLQDHAPDLYVNMTGSARGTSLVGNIVDRGHGWVAPRIDDVRGLEVLLGSGKLIRTGFWHIPDARASRRWRHGVGPSLDGLFTQGNFGIVTAAAVRLRNRPESLITFAAGIRRDADLAGFTDALATLHRHEILRTVTHIFDSTRIRKALGPDTYSWLACGSISGTTRVAEALWHEVCTALEPISSVIRVDEFTEGTLQSSLRSIAGIIAGEPNDIAVSALMREYGDESSPENLDQGRTGILFCLPTSAFDGRSAVSLVNLARTICSRNAFRSSITLNAINERTLQATIDITFDRHSPEHVNSARKCMAQLHESLPANGFIPYRVGIHDMHAIVDSGDPFWGAVADIKSALDPDHVISPGRYNLL